MRREAALAPEDPGVAKHSKSPSAAALASQVIVPTEGGPAAATFRESERRYRDLFERNLAGMFRSTPEGGILDCNDSFAHMFGYASREELLSRPASDLYHSPQDRDDFVRLLRERGSVTEYERMFRRKDRSPIWVVENVELSIDEDGREIMMGTLIDISARKRAEQLLTGQNKVLHLLTLGRPLSEVLTALCLAVEECAEGMSASVLLLDDATQTLRHGAAPSLPEAYNRAVNGVPVGPSAGSCGTAAWRRLRVIVSDIANDPLWAEIHPIATRSGLRACWSEPIFASDGRVLGTMAMYYGQPRSPTEADLEIITNASRLASLAIERSHEAEMRRAHEARLRAILDAEPECVKVVGSDGTLLEMNLAGLPMIGARSLDQVIGRCAFELVHEDDRAAYIERHKAVATTGEQGMLQYRIVGLTDVERWVESNSAPLRDAHGVVTSVLSVTRDITERRKAEQQLRDRHEVERMLFRELDHRVRNNLASLLTLIDLTRGGTSDVNQFAQSIAGRIEAMSRVHTLLTQTQWKYLDLQQLIDTASPPMSGSRVKCEGERVVIPARQVTAIAIVVHELMTNSQKHGALKTDKGEIHVRWCYERDMSSPRRLIIRWTEHGGPPIDSPRGKGVGTGLIEGLTKAELGGSVTLNFPRDGAQHELTVTLDAAESSPSPAA